MPRDDAQVQDTLLPTWTSRERQLAHMLPYVSLVDGQTVRTRGNELFQCLRLKGVNSNTTHDAYLDKHGRSLLRSSPRSVRTSGSTCTKSRRGLNTTCGQLRAMTLQRPWMLRGAVLWSNVAFGTKR